MYADIKKSLEDLPATWYPALLKTLVIEADNKSVFVKPDGCQKFVGSCLKEFRKAAAEKLER